MSNIYQHNFDNCMKMRLSNSDYWDLFLCYDCTDEQDNNQILDDCILVDIDINNDNSFSGDTNGEVGTITWDNNYIYVKTSGGWGRAQLDFAF